MKTTSQVTLHLKVTGEVVFIQLWVTDKRDPMYYTSKRPSESHNDGHPKKIRVAILDFGNFQQKILLMKNTFT
jgi:hypothetical protein